MGSETLAACAVTHAFDGHVVLRDISLSVGRGQMLALVGPNGSGKTTLLRVLSGATRPDRGQAQVGDTLLARLGRRDLGRRLAVVPQHTDPSLLFTVRQLVAMGRSPYLPLLGSQRMEDRRAVQAALRATELEDLADERFAELSGGEQQRVSLATALAQETPFLLLDEPTVHLDLHHQHRLLELLATLRDERALGILAVMHDLNLAALYFDRIAVLDGGRLAADGTPDEILHSDALTVFDAPLVPVRHPESGRPQVLLGRC